MKVYIVMRYDYEYNSIEAIYTTPEAAEHHIERERREAFERDGRKAERRATGYEWSAALGNLIMERTPDGRVLVSPNVAKAKATGYTDIPAETYEEFVKRREDGLEVDEHEVVGPTVTTIVTDAWTGVDQ